MRYILCVMILAGCTSSQSSSLIQSDPDMAFVNQDMGKPSNSAADMDTNTADADTSAPDMLVGTDMLASTDMLVSPDILAPADMTQQPDLTPTPDLTPPGPDMTGLYCHSNATNYPGDTATWCSTYPISATSQAQAQDACQQYNGPARVASSTCYACVTFNTPGTGYYYAFSSQVVTNTPTRCAGSVPYWVYNGGVQGYVNNGDIGNGTTAVGRWAP